MVWVGHGQGALVAGKGGTGLTAGKAGSISGVTADRIATIIAGKTAANALTSANAVTAISGIITSAIGADFDHDGVFDFTNTVGTVAFELGDAFAGTSDTVIDGSSSAPPHLPSHAARSSVYVSTGRRNSGA